MAAYENMPTGLSRTASPSLRRDSFEFVKPAAPNPYLLSDRHIRIYLCVFPMSSFPNKGEKEIG